VHSIKREVPVDLLWAEAVFEYRMGAEPYLPPELEAQAYEVQESHREVNAKVGMIEEFLEIPLPSKYDSWTIEQKRQWYLDRDLPGISPRDYVCGLEIYLVLFGGNRKDYETKQQREMRTCLATIRGWEPSESQRRIPGFGKQRVYVKSVSQVPVSSVSCSTSQIQ